VGVFLSALCSWKWGKTEWLWELEAEGGKVWNGPKASLGPDGEVLQHEPEADAVFCVCELGGADAAAADEVAGVVTSDGRDCWHHLPWLAARERIAVCVQERLNVSFRVRPTASKDRIQQTRTLVHLHDKILPAHTPVVPRSRPAADAASYTPAALHSASHASA